VNENEQAATFEQVAMPHLHAAYNLARWLAGNDHDAEDVTQEAMLRALRFFAGFRGGDARTWLLTIVRNTYYSHWRRARGRDAATEFDEEVHSLDGDALGVAAHDANPERIYARTQDVKLLDRALGEIPAEYREALVLREIEDLSYKAIAELLAVPMGTVMSRISRGRRLLLDAFERLSAGTRDSRKARAAG
jgi:RNA polymerase sigma-70 factor (ECF subfamily)